MTIKVVYCANYNGAYIEYSSTLDEESVESCVTDIVDEMVEDCSKYGVWCGDEDDAIDNITNIVREHFGDVEVVVQFDYISS